MSRNLQSSHPVLCHLVRPLLSHPDSIGTPLHLNGRHPEEYPHLQLGHPPQLPWLSPVTNSRADVAPKPPFALQFRPFFPKTADFFSAPRCFPWAGPRALSDPRPSRVASIGFSASSGRQQSPPHGGGAISPAPHPRPTRARTKDLPDPSPTPIPVTWGGVCGPGLFGKSGLGRASARSGHVSGWLPLVDNHQDWG